MAGTRGLKGLLEKRAREVSVLLLVGVVVPAAAVLAFLPDEAPAGDLIAPDFSIVDAYGQAIEMRELRGRVVVLDFMATWCSVCNSTVDELDAVHRAYDASQVVIISISIDPDYDTDDRLRGYAEWHGSEWSHARDVERINVRYGIGGLPTIIVVDQDGVMAFRSEGFVSRVTLMAEVDALL